MIGILSCAALVTLLLIGTLRTPSAGFAGVLCLFGLKQWGQNSAPFIAEHRTATNLVIGALLLLGILVRAARGQCLFCRFPAAALFVAALWGYALVTLLWTPDPTGAFEVWQTDAPYMAAIAFGGPLLIGSLRDMRACAYWTIAIGTAVMGLAMVYGQWGIRGLTVLGDIRESESNPLALASMAGTVAVFAALSMQRTMNIAWRVVFLLVIPLGFAVILRSGSRGQLVAAAVAIVLLWPVAYRQRHIGSRVLWLVAATSISLLAWVGTSFVASDRRWSAAVSGADVAGRLDMSLTLIRRAISSPFSFVFGLGNSSSFHYLGLYPHVAFLEILGEEGLVGASLFACIAFLALRSTLRLARYAKEPDARATLGLLGGAFIFELILSMKQGTLLSCTYVFAYAIVLGRLERTVREVRERSRRSARPPPATARPLTIAHEPVS